MPTVQTAVSRRTPLMMILVAALALWPRPATAWDFSIADLDFSLDATDTLEYTYLFFHENSSHSDLPTETQLLRHQIVNTLDASLSHDMFRLGARMDLNLFADRAYDGEQCNQASGVGPSWCTQKDIRYLNNFALERIFFTVAVPEFDLTLGDFYVSLGKGIALNVVKLGELAQDNAVRGGKMAIHHGPVGLTVIGGEINLLDTDGPTGFVTPWNPDALLGGRLELQVSEGIIVGAHSVYIMTNCESSWCAEVVGDSSTPGSHLVAGAGLDMPDLMDGDLSVSAEFDIQRETDGGKVVRAPWEQDDHGRGIAAYANSTLQLGDLTMMGEFKYYDGFEVAGRKANTVNGRDLGFDRPMYNQPPTLERMTALINNNFSVGGGRIRADYNFGELGQLGFLGTVELLAYLNFGFFQNWGNREDDPNTGNHPEVSRRVYNPFGGLEALWMDGLGTLKIEAGVRHEHELDWAGVFMQDAFFELDLEQAFLERHAVKLSYKLLNRTKGKWVQQGLGQFSRGSTTWNEMELFVTYKWSPHLEFTFTYERQEEEGYEPNYLGGSVRYYITPGTYAQVRVGQNRPGIKCLNGACRQMPAFSGANVTVVGRL